VSVPDPTKVIAFYLPQFHPVAENDAWWGEGFTEWRNVVKARPLFEGHYQPHLPGSLGFYDLRLPEVRERQASLAARHGIDGFMYYHYWFGGRRVLDRTFEEVLTSGRPDYPFCLCWANENWTRIWDGGENAILLEQRYDAEERAEHLAFLVRAFADPRYIHHEGRPLFAVYRVQSLPDGRHFIEELREACATAGLPDPWVVKFDTRGYHDDPAESGCDAAAQFPPHGIDSYGLRNTNEIPGAVPGHEFIEYDALVRGSLAAPMPDWVRHEAVLPCWDNTSRRAEQTALVVTDSTPEAYEHWLREVHGRAPSRGGIVFVNAWNEWAEGAHLEPDERWGDAYLRATARAVLGHEPLDTAEPDSEERVEVLTGPTFGELYLDIYERYVRTQRRLTSVEATIRREVERRTAILERELVDERERSNDLAHQLATLLASPPQGSERAPRRA
jgi:hypothetical protein